MLGYNPYGAYASPYGYTYSSPDVDYLRALAQERAAQEQLLAARRAQEEACHRAERARLTHQGYGMPLQYNPTYDDLDDYEDHDAYDGGFMPYGRLGGYGPNAHQRKLEQERRRALQRELERRNRDQELERLRFAEEKRQLEEARRRLIEEERRQRIRAEELRRREQNCHRQQASQFDPQFSAFGYEDGNIMTSPRMDRRSHSIAPTHNRGSQGSSARSYLKPSATTSRSSSVASRSAASPAPARPSAPYTGHFSIPIRTPSPSPPSPRATPAQHEAARKIQEAYRTHAARSSALRAISAHHSKFVQLRTGFRFPSNLDFAVAPGSHDHISVPVDPTARAALILPDGATVEEGRSRRPELAYTSQNASVHGYLEELNRMLSALDAIESGGDKEVREKRKGLVREVEAEAERVEAVVGEVWAKWQAQQEREEDAGSQTEDATKVTPTSEQAEKTMHNAIAQQSTAVQQDEKRMDVENTDLPTLPDARLLNSPVQAHTESAVSMTLGVHEATTDLPTGGRQEETRMDVEQTPGDERNRDIVPHVSVIEPIQAVLAERSSVGVSMLNSAGKAHVEDGWIDIDRSRVDGSECMQLDASETTLPMSAVTDNARVGLMHTGVDSRDIVDCAPILAMDVADDNAKEHYLKLAMTEQSEVHQMSDSVVDSAPSPEGDLAGMEREKDVGYEAVDKEVDGPVVEQPPWLASPHHEHPELGSSPIGRRSSLEGEPLMSAAGRYERSTTPTLSPSRGGAESEEEGPSTPLMESASCVILTATEGYQNGVAELERKELQDKETIYREGAH